MAFQRKFDNPAIKSYKSALVKREKSNSKGGICHIKKPITKNQIVTHFAEKFELSKKTASSIIDEMAMLATDETKKTGAFTLLALVNLSLLSVKLVWGEIQHG